MKKSLTSKAIKMPEEFQRFFDLPAMVGGEKYEDYFEFHSAIGNAVKPTSIFEWIWVEGFVRAEWDVRLNRQIKIDFIKSKEQELLAEQESKARMIRYRIEAIRAERLAEAEAKDPGKAQEDKKDAIPEAVKLEVPKIEDPYLLAKVFERFGDVIDEIDRRISASEKKRDGILREIYRHRESLARRLEQATIEIVEGEFTEEEE
jgi:hypothetical protein